MGDSHPGIPDSWACILPVAGSSPSMRAKLPGFGSPTCEKVPPVFPELDCAPLLTGAVGNLGERVGRTWSWRRPGRSGTDLTGSRRALVPEASWRARPGGRGPQHPSPFRSSLLRRGGRGRPHPAAGHSVGPVCHGSGVAEAGPGGGAKCGEAVGWDWP